MTDVDPLSCSFEDARRTNRLRGLKLSTSARVDFFEEMVTFAHRFGARDRLAGRNRSQEATTLRESLVGESGGPV